jgi:hypothetical protein
LRPLQGQGQGHSTQRGAAAQGKAKKAALLHSLLTPVLAAECRLGLGLADSTSPILGAETYLSTLVSARSLNHHIHHVNTSVSPRERRSHRPVYLSHSNRNRKHSQVATMGLWGGSSVPKPPPPPRSALRYVLFRPLFSMN